ncbi:hypothetical protein FHS74_005837 [Nitrospirillum iridis]|uniref:Uncharacterized protein n=1 Tax=Nitrospirillum iridis TaxID=765888 RepID=A0A7X0EFQ1_9PROT|nr:hypothetical protein [Nitrospirillum iridis]
MAHQTFDATPADGVAFGPQRGVDTRHAVLNRAGIVGGVLA